MFLVVLAISVLTASGCATLESLQIRRGEAYVKVVFTNRDRMIIRDYYAHKKAPPGLAKRTVLPPGLQKRVDRGDPLPPGLQGRGLPGDLESRLSVLPAGYIRLKIGADIIIKNVNTGVVTDIIYGVD